MFDARSKTWVGAMLLAVGSLACESLSPEFDGQVRTVMVDTRFQVAPPEAPRLPMMTPCPSGWREADAGVTAICEPWPDTGPLECPDDAAHFPGEAQCARVGTACSADPWADGLPAGRPMLYVLAGAVGGSGTRAAPYGSLAAALAASTPSTVVALGPGTYTTSSSLPAQVTLWGACVAKTTVTSATGGVVISARAPGIEVHNLRVVGGRMGLSVSSAQASLRVEDVVVETSQETGWSVENLAASTGKNVVVRKMAGLPDGTAGVGIDVMTGAGLVASRVVVDEARQVGVEALDPGTRVELTDVAIRRTHARQRGGLAGYGVGADLGATMSLTRAVVELSHDTGVIALGGATTSLTDTVVRDTLGSEADGLKGYGVLAIGSTVTGQRVLLERNRVGAKVRDSGGRLTLSDSVSRLNIATSETGTGSGLQVVSGASAQLERVLLDRNRVSALGLGSAGTFVTATDLVASGTEPGLMGEGGWGIALLQGAQLVAQRVRLQGNTWVGMSAAASTVLTGSDLTIEGTRASPQGNGAGLLLQAGTKVTLTRGQLVGNAVIGLVEEGASTTLEVHDFGIDDTSADPIDGLEGEGAMVFGGAQLTGDRVRVQGNKTVGVFASGPGTRVALSQVEVSDVTAPPCFRNPMCDGLQPTGVLVVDAAQLQLTTFLITRNGGIGAQIATGGQLDLVDGEISHHAIGVNSDTDTDASRISNQVRYVDDGQKVGGLMVPLPSLPRF